MKRRDLLKSILCATTALPLASLTRPAIGGVLPSSPGDPDAGHHILRIARRTIDVRGRAATVFGILQPDGVHGLSLPAQSPFDVVLRNETTEPSIVHWHGLTPPWEQDGVGQAPLPLIDQKAERHFHFSSGAPGTHWMHAHTLQEQVLLAAPLIVLDPAERNRDEQAVTILLHDFSFTPPEELLARLQGGTTHGDASRIDHSSMGHAPAAPTAPNMTAGMDLNDIDYDAYLANDRTLDDPEVVRIESGGRVRLRLINGATATAFTIDTGRIAGTLIAVDGQDVAPITARRFPIAMGQRLDIRVELPRDGETFPILALREGARERTGLILAPRDVHVSKIAPLARTNGPVVDLDLEASLSASWPLPSREPSKQFLMRLVGGMQGYRWGLDITPTLVVRANDRAEVTMVNDTMMSHPMHLHGHHFQVVAIDGRRFSGAVRDTVHIPPHRSVTIAFDALNPGQWAFHCHHLYHMAAGMRANVNYQS